MLLDKLARPLRDLRISVIDACNFRCTYCMPKHLFPKNYQFLPNSALLSFDEIVQLTKVFVKLGVRKIRLTGGEPLLRKDLHVLVERLRQIPNVEDIALTTNGFLLAKKAEQLKKAGLNRITVSLDALTPAVFQEMSGVLYTPEQILNGIEVALASGFSPIKINVVVKKNVNEHEVLHIARYFKGKPVIIRFIEYMDVGTVNGWLEHEVIDFKSIIANIHQQMPLEPLPALSDSDVAIRYGYQDKQGEIGFITSITKPFCRKCVRGRLSADGSFYTCLFSDKGLKLRDFLKQQISDDELETIITRFWQKRDDRYSETRLQKNSIPLTKISKVEMFRMGG